MNSSGKILIGFLLGALFGSATALLMAPTTGRTARKNLNRKAKKLVKKIEPAVGKEKKRTTSASQSKNGKAEVAAK